MVLYPYKTNEKMTMLPCRRKHCQPPRQAGMITSEVALNTGGEVSTKLEPPSPELFHLKLLLIEGLVVEMTLYHWVICFTE